MNDLLPSLICLGLLIFLAYKENQWKAREHDWGNERQLLITRIQHPEFIVSEPEKPTIPDEQHMTAELDEIDLVGKTIMNGSDGDE